MFDLYVVTDSDLSRGRTDAETARLAYEGGADAVQLRMKHTDRWGWQAEIVAYEKAENGSAPADEADADENYEEAPDTKDDIPF